MHNARDMYPSLGLSHTENISSVADTNNPQHCLGNNTLNVNPSYLPTFADIFLYFTLIVSLVGATKLTLQCTLKVTNIKPDTVGELDAVNFCDWHLQHDNYMASFEMQLRIIWF